jgi:hypothetical protein
VSFDFFLAAVIKNIGHFRKTSGALGWEVSYLVSGEGK